LEQHEYGTDEQPDRRQPTVDLAELHDGLLECSIVASTQNSHESLQAAAYSGVV
jgi:hypothetical protein